MKKKLALLLVTTFILSFCLPLNVQAQDSLTLDEAFSLAKKQSKTLRGIDLDIERGEEVRKSAADKVNFIPSGPSDPVAAAAWTGLLMSDMSLMMTKKSKTVEEDKIYLEVLEKYIAVLKAQESYNYAVKSNGLADKSFRVSMLSYDVGAISKNEMLMSNIGARRGSKAVDAARVDLDKAYSELNSLLGYPSGKRSELVYDEEFTPLEIQDIDVEITRIMSNNPAVWLADRKADLAKVSLDLYSWNDPNREPYEAKKIDVDKAELDAQKLSKDMKNGLLSVYQSIKQLEEAYYLAEEGLKSSEAEYRNKEILFSVGMSTSLELEQAKLNLDKAQNDLNQIALKHKALKEMFYKPWAAK